MTKISLDGNCRPPAPGLYRFEKQDRTTIWRKYDKDWYMGEFDIKGALMANVLSSPPSTYVERAMDRGYQVYFECYLSDHLPPEPQQLELF